MLEMDPDREAAASSSRADITFGREPGGRTFVKRQFAAYPFHICRPHYFSGDPAGMTTLYLQSLSGGFYEHERLSLTVAAQPETRVHLTSQASTIVHSMESGHASLAVSVDAQEGALFEYVPDPLILFPRAHLVTTVKVRWHDAATVICADAFLAHDPEGMGRAFGKLDSRVDVETPDGRLLVRDRFVLGGDAYRDRLSRDEDGNAALATIVVLSGRARLEAMLAALRSALEDLPDTYAGTSALPNGCGLRARLLCADGASLRVAMDTAWAAARETITGARPPKRRK